MIDTLVIRIKNLSKYKYLYEQYYAPAKKKGTITEAFVDESTGEYKQVDYVHTLIYHDTDRFLPVVHRSTRHIASSHYQLSFVLNPSKDFLEFNFSVPKYVYGTNVLQFVSLYDQGASVCFSMLLQFIDRFIESNCVEKPLRDDIEINRVDLCYNQFFNSKDDALLYLQEQNKLVVKNARSSRNKFRSYDTSIMYTTRRYSFKIYHKGTEFEKNDRKELLKSNPRGYKLEELQAAADCVLRYEMTFRSSYFDYVLEQYYYSSEKRAVDVLYNQHPIAKRFADVVSFGGQKLAESFFKNAKDFKLKSVWDYRVADVGPVALESREATFDFRLFSILFERFWQKVNDYQINRVLDINDLSRRIDEKFETDTLKKTLRSAKEVGADRGKVRLLSTALLAHYMNLEELKSFLPKRSFYRMKKDLKDLGISTVQHNLSIPQPRLDYSDYKIYLSKYHNE